MIESDRDKAWYYSFVLCACRFFFIRCLMHKLAMQKIRRYSSYTPRRYTIANVAICTILFWGYSFVYLYFMQGELMRCLCREWLGRDVYPPFWGALTITFALWIGQWLLDKCTRFSSVWYALSYFPAYWALAFLTSVTPVEVAGELSLEKGGLWWLFPVALLVYLVVGYACKHWRRYADRQTLTELLIPNMILLILFSYATGSVGNCNELLHNELHVSEYIREQRYEEALHVGEKSLHNTHSLTTLRALALSHTEELGESLFAYPQSHRADGLFFQEGVKGLCGLSNADIVCHLGGIPREDGESVTNYLNRICEADSMASSKSWDYYLCALLLERRLECFHQTLLHYWPKDRDLPRHYQEALLVYQLEKGEDSPLAPLCTIAVRERYEAFGQLQKQYEIPLHRNNYTRRKFGDTYWWYYYYGE